MFNRETLKEKLQFLTRLILCCSDTLADKIPNNVHQLVIDTIFTEAIIICYGTRNSNTLDLKPSDKIPFLEFRGIVEPILKALFINLCSASATNHTYASALEQEQAEINKAINLLADKVADHFNCNAKSIYK